MTATPSPGVLRLAFFATALSFASSSAALAQVVIVPATPQVGSSNPITAEPPVSRPHSKPCVVDLFQNLAFADFNTKSFNYTPPSSCPGPWAKVVFTADFTVTAGRQFDRTAAFYLGHSNIYYGTTAEPRSILSPSWHVERDVTDLTAVFRSTQIGEANIGNFVGVSGGVTYSGIIYANAALEFYPASEHDPVTLTPDIVVPVNGTGGDAGTLNTTASQLRKASTCPLTSNAFTLMSSRRASPATSSGTSVCPANSPPIFKVAATPLSERLKCRSTGSRQEWPLSTLGSIQAGSTPTCGSQFLACRR